MTLTVEQITRRLEEIEAAVEERQAAGETAAKNFYMAKRDYELAYARQFVTFDGSVTEKKHMAAHMLAKDPLYYAMKESEGAYEGWKAIMRALELRASIGQSLLKSQRETGG